MLVLCVACQGDGLELAAPNHSTWITEAEHQFGDAPERDLFFSQPYVRADPPRNRVFVLDGPSAQVSAWTTEGSLRFVVGRTGEGPGEFITAQDMVIDEDGSFGVLEFNGSRFTYFTAGGALIETVQGMDTRLSYQGFGLKLYFPSGGVHLGFASAPVAVDGGAPWRSI